ncbi:MAG: ATP-dependent helicase [Vicinamibacteria bacterium]|nr:ATP-dependent helicase [Vicinamibacteria bacterium]
MSDIETRPRTREETILEGLNEAQRGAVLHGDGPLLIVAGAGTGKTTVLTRRIAHLITTKRARPEEILALTFTEKAAREMSERVDQLVPYGYTESFIATFHAFGDRMLRENCFAAGLSADFRVLSRADEIVFLRERLFSLPLARFRPLGDPGRHLPTLVEFASRAKDEDVPPDAIRAFAKEQLRRFSGVEGDEALSLREQALDLIEAAEFFKAQQDALAASALVDFGDQIHLFLKLLRQRPDVAIALRKRFRYILVDEFQDTNHAQLELVRLIAGEGRPNITVVGDDDQAIYRWRGAAPANLIHFLSLYPEAARVVLRQNYRSTQEILDTAYRLITYNNPHRLEAMTGLDKRLVAERGKGRDVAHWRFPSASAEADAVAKAIEEFHQRDSVPLDEIAILVRNNADADPFLRALNMRGLPHRFSGGAGLFERPEVRSLIAFLRLVASPDDSVSAWALAFSEIYAFDPVDLSRMSRYASKKTRPLLDVFRELEGNEDLASVKGPSREAAKRFVADLERGVSSMAHKRTGEALYEFLKESGYLARLASVSSAKDERKVANIARFFEIVRGFSMVAEHDHIPSFVARFDLLRDAGEDPSAIEIQEGDAVNIMTVHKAKGLEFRVVFVASCIDQKFPLRRRSDPLPLPAPLLKSDLSPGDAHLMEERRLFYVSMTRAKDDLILTSADDYGAGATRKVSRFVVEALDLPSPRARVARSSPLETIAASAPVPDGLSPAPAGASAEPESLAAAMAPPLRLSFRQVDDYLTCPLKYRFVHRNRIPLLTHHRVVYGSAIHQAVQDMFKARQAAVAFGVEDLVAAFRRAWVSEGFLSREHEELRLREGERTLTRFFAWEKAHPLRPTGVEEDFSFPILRTRVMGRYDLVVAGDDGVTILDFKTGDVNTQARAQQRAEESLQLAIYALAHLRTTGALPSRVELRFLETDLVGGFRPSEALALATEKAIADVADRISRGRFEATPSHAACRPCPFRDVCPATAKDD